MSFRIAYVVAALLYPIIGCSPSNTTGPSDQSQGSMTIVGKWAPKDEAAKNLPEGSFVEYTNDGRILIHINRNGKLQAAPMGTYGINGDKLTLTPNKSGVKDHTTTIKSLTDDELVLLENDGRVEKWQRVK